MKVSKHKILSVFLSISLLLQTAYNVLPSAYAQEIFPPSEIPSVSPTPTTTPSENQTITPLVIEDTPATPQDPNKPILQEDSTLPNSAVFTPPKILRSLMKRSFKADEKITLSVANAETADFTTTVEYSDGTMIDIQTSEIKIGQDTQIQIDPPRSFKPGKYKAKVNIGGQIYEQDFSWGILSINTNKSMYLPSEEVRLAMAVLDERGEMVCNADLELKIRNRAANIDETLSTQNGKIKVNPNCYEKKMTLIPDYEANYQLTNAVGTYEMVLTANTTNGTYSIDDSFQVHETVDFDVERISATRLYPPETYPVTFKIKANRDFNGKIVDLVPDSFGISQLSGVQQYNEVKVSDDQTLQKEAVLGAQTIALPFKGEEPITQGFGSPLRDPLLKKLYFRYGLAGHDGMDFGVAEGSEVVSVDDGTVVLADYGGVYGATIVIEHKWGKSYYGHLSEFVVKNGDSVKRGDTIALSGSTGLSTGPHLHFGVKLNENNNENGFYGKVNPAPYLGIKADPNVLGVTTSSETFQAITWDVSIKKGDEFTLGYQFKAPPDSPQLYRLGTLRFYESGNPDPIFKEARQWMLANDAPSNQFVKTGTFTKTTSSPGPVTQSVTGLGFKPKAIIFYWTNNISLGSSSMGNGVGGSWGMGFTTGASNERALSMWEEGENAPGATDNGRATYNTSMIAIQGTNGALTFGNAELTSFDSDGFTLNWTVSDNQPYIIHYQAFSDTLLSNAIAESFTVPTGTPNYTVSVSNAGFQPEFILLLSGGTSAHNANTAELTYSIGAATSASSEWTVSGRSDDAVDSSDTCTMNNTTASIYLIGLTVACGTTTEDAVVDFTQFTANGFDLNVSNSPSSSFDVFYLALKGNNTFFQTGNFVQPTNPITGINFKPAGMFFISDAREDVVDLAQGIFAMGTTSGVNEEASISISGDDAEDAYDPDFNTSSSTLFQVRETDAATLTFEAKLVSFNNSTVDLNIITNPSQADGHKWWSISDPINPPSSLMRHGKWFGSDGTEQPFAF